MCGLKIQLKSAFTIIAWSLFFASSGFAGSRSVTFNKIQLIHLNFEKLNSDTLSDQWRRFWPLVDEPKIIDDRRLQIKYQVGTIRRYAEAGKRKDEIESLEEESRELGEIRLEWTLKRWDRMRAFYKANPIRARIGLEKIFQKEFKASDVGGTLWSWGMILSEMNSGLASQAWKAHLFHPSKLIHGSMRSYALRYFEKKKNIGILIRYIRDDSIPGNSHWEKGRILKTFKGNSDIRIESLLLELTTHEYPFLAGSASEMLLERGQTETAIDAILAVIHRVGPEYDALRVSLMGRLHRYRKKYPHKYARYTHTVPDTFAKKILAEKQYYSDYRKAFLTKLELAKQIIEEGGRSSLIEELKNSIAMLMDWPLVLDYISGNGVYHTLARALALSLSKSNLNDDNAKNLRAAGRILETSVIRFLTQMGEVGMQEHFVRFVGMTGLKQNEYSSDAYLNVSENQMNVGWRELGEAFSKVPYFNERFLKSLYALGLQHHPTRLAHAFYKGLLETHPGFPKQIFTRWLDEQPCYRAPDENQVGRLVGKYGQNESESYAVVEALYGAKTAQCISNSVRESVAKLLLGMGVVPVSYHEKGKYPSTYPDMKDAYALIGDFFPSVLSPLSLGRSASYVFDRAGQRVPLPHPAAYFGDQYHLGKFEQGKWNHGFLPMRRIRKAVKRSNDTMGPIRLTVYLNQLDSFLISSAARAYFELGLLNQNYLDDFALPDEIFERPCWNTDKQVEGFHFIPKSNHSVVPNCLIADSFHRYRAARIKAQNRERTAPEAQLRRKIRTSIHRTLISDYEKIILEIGGNSGVPDGPLPGQRENLRAQSYAKRLWDEKIKNHPERLEVLRVIDLFGDESDDSERTFKTWMLIASAYLQAVHIEDSFERRENVRKKIYTKLNSILYARLKDKLRIYRDALIKRAKENKVRDILERVGGNEVLATLLHSEIEGHYLQGHWGYLKGQYADQLHDDHNQAIVEGIVFGIGETAILAAVTGGVGVLIKGASLAARAGVVVQSTSKIVRIGAAIGRMSNAIRSVRMMQYLAGPNLIPRALRFLPKMVGKYGVATSAAAYSFLIPQRANLYRRHIEARTRFETPIDSYRKKVWKALWSRRRSGSNDSSNLQKFMYSPAQKSAADDSFNSVINAQWSFVTASLFVPVSLEGLGGVATFGKSMALAPKLIAGMGFRDGMRAAFRAGIPASWSFSAAGGFAVFESAMHVPASAFFLVQPAKWIETEISQYNDRVNAGEKHRGTQKGSILLLLAEARRLRTTPGKIMEIEKSAKMYLERKNLEHLQRLEKAIAQFTVKK